ncbi:MAG: ABC transporter permease subunit [bacterium]
MNTLKSVWHERPRLFNNPVIRRELINRLRKPSTFVYFLILLVILFVYVLMFWYDHLNHYNAYSNPRETIFLFNFMQGLFAFLLIPILSSSAINLEFERQSWDLLCTTHLNTASILFAKFLTSILVFGLMSAALIPFYGIILTGGSVDPWEIFFFYLIILEGIVLIALMGLLCSTLFRKTVQAITATYIAAACFYVLPIFLVILTEVKFRQPLLSGIPVLLSPLFVILTHLEGPPPTSIVSPFVARHIFLTHFILISLTILILAVVCMVLIRRKSGESSLSVSQFTRNHTRAGSSGTPSEISIRYLIPERFNPVYYKERREYQKGFPINLLSGAALFGSGYLLIAFFYYLDRPNSFSPEPLVFIATFLNPLFIIPYAVNTFRNEKDCDTWELLRTTILTGNQIIYGKLFYGARLLANRFLLFYLPVLIYGLWIYDPAHAYAIRYRIFIWLILLLNLISGTFYLCLGMLFSAISRSTIAAYVLMIICVASLYILPSLMLDTMRQFNLFDYSMEAFILGILSPIHFAVSAHRRVNENEAIPIYFSFITLCGWMVVISCVALHWIRRYIHARR